MLNTFSLATNTNERTDRVVGVRGEHKSGVTDKCRIATRDNTDYRNEIIYTSR